MKRISVPIESKMAGRQAGDTLLRADYLVIGSGYGGAVAAMRLAGRGAGAAGADRDSGVVVLERGREYGLGDFPYDIEDLPSHIRMLRTGSGPSGYPDALFNLHVGVENRDPAATDKDRAKGRDRAAADVLVGSGLGGTSLINANVAERPEPHVFCKPRWPREFREAPGLLDTAYTEVAARLGVAGYTGGEDGEFPKYTALRQLGAALGHEARPAGIAVTTASGDTARTRTNPVGVEQSPCTDCGNCVTGCNVGAKNTLDRNLLRLAKSRGADFYTGATVQRIEPLAAEDAARDEGYRWAVILHPTVKPTEKPRAHAQGAVEYDTYRILAKNVILAAGSLGSTEILLRSQAPGVLEFSEALGQKFSTNGDGIIMSYGQRRRVGAVAEAEQRAPSKAVGPTITGIIRTGALSIEEASIPAALGRVFAELVTSSAMLQRITKRKLPAVFDGGDHDPLAAPLALADHCQALLVMGDDGADGQLSLSPGRESLDIAFPAANISENAALAASNALVQAQDRKAGLDGGQYAPNPLWQLLPPQAADALNGAMPTRRVLTVHPLGGCAMADDASGGVVNHRGQVFRRDGQLHDGLFVMDGAIIPAALEVNPFLTIAALAWRNTGLILGEVEDTGSATVSPGYADLGEVPRRYRDAQRPTAFVLQEQLTGKLDGLVPALRQHLDEEQQQRLLQRDGLVVQVSASSEDAQAWLDNPGVAPLKASMYLYVNPMTLEQVNLYNPVGVPPALVDTLPPMMVLQGQFTVFAEDAHSWLTDMIGAWRAYLAYRKRRGRIRLAAPDEPGFLADPCGFIQRLYNSIRVSINIGAMQSRCRRLSYAFTHRASGVSIEGQKVLGYSPDIDRMWDGLLNLDIRIAQRDGQSCGGRLGVNTESLLDPGLVAITASANLPRSLLFAGGLAGFVARSLFATNFWEFGGLEYRESPPERPQPAALHTPKSGVVAPDAPVFFDVPLQQGSARSVTLRLTRYGRENAKPLLMLHGLAQGSQIFWLPGITNLAAYCYDEGFDVWLLDYRLSNLVLPALSPEDRQWSMDEIARFDIPAAIRKVCELTGRDKIAVFGHCVGACTLAMAALRDRDIGARIEAAVTNAIHPWVMPSPANRLRAKFGNFYREWVPEEILEPNPAKGAGGVQNILDRLAFSLARINELEKDDHRDFGGSELAQGICDRMTFLYGRMWNHKNLSDGTHEAFTQMLGPAPASVYQHLYYYSSLRRITDREGENTYLTASNIRNNWQFPILFIHGNDSRVFNPHSARRSARRLHDILNGSPASPPGAAPQGDRIPVRYKIYPDYGHMDVIFAENAHASCFGDYVNFLRDPHSFPGAQGEPDWQEPYLAKPLTGPILRAAWVEDGRIRLRVWAELRTNVTYQPDKLEVSGGREVAEFELAVPAPSRADIPRFRMIDVEVDTPGRIRLSLRGRLSHHRLDAGATLAYEDEAWLHRLRADAAHQPRPGMCFIVGSCRYPGSIVDNALSDKVYAAIERQVTAVTGAQMLLLIGDQIYADATDQLVEMKSQKAKYSDRYHRAFGAQCSPNFARLVQQVPTHFALDDHEKVDDWSGSPTDLPVTPGDSHDYAAAMAARYLGSGRSTRAVHGEPACSLHYYALAHPQECDFPVFMTDTRSERDYRDSNDPGRHHLMKDAQYGALTDWLSAAQRDHPRAPKFIVSGSILAPLPISYLRAPATWRQQDGWAGYPQTAESLLQFIAERGIANVVFVGGDAHLSAVSRLRLSLDGSNPVVEVWQIVSSGLYAPLPFANAHVEDFLWDQSHALPVHTRPSLAIACTNTLLSDHYSQFVRVEATTGGVRVACFDESNTLLAQHELKA
ncbi:MAG: alpha/beta fold hydrolase [Halioglobus sp.]|nr:alpha/beta fold hydrolase [Halioglobus sp.]